MTSAASAASALSSVRPCDLGVAWAQLNLPKPWQNAEGPKELWQKSAAQAAHAGSKIRSGDRPLLGIMGKIRGT